MPRSVVVLLVIAFCSLGCSRTSNSNLDRVGFVMDDQVELAIEDVKGIARAAGVDLSVAVEVDPTIEDPLSQHSSYRFRAGDKSLIVRAANSQGVVNGLYGFLNELGYRFYFPGDLWTIMPPSDVWQLDLQGAVEPLFRGRRFFGGGGYPRNHPADPDNSVKEEWELWQLRNRFGADYHSKGHVWQDFIRRSKSLIAEHPEYVSKSGKQLCVTNVEVQSLFVDYCISRLERDRKRFGAHDPRALTVGVDPNDGGGHCECTECTRLGSVSNRVFFLSNIVAKALQKSYPGVVVSLSAYNEHAAPPTIDIEPNTLVSVVPYAFQDVAAPEELLRLWAEKHDLLQARDYWALVIWNQATPDYDYLGKTRRRLAAWKNLGYDRFLIETTYGIGPAGIPLYLASTMAWGEDEDLHTICTDLFGTAAPAMERMLQRWSDYGLSADVEMQCGYADIAEALDLATEPVQKERILQWQYYLDVITKIEAVRDTKVNSQKRKNDLEHLIEFSYGGIENLMIHSYWFPNPMMRTFDRKAFNNSTYRQAERKLPETYWQKVSRRPIVLSERARYRAVDRLDQEGCQPINSREIIAYSRKYYSPILEVKDTRSYSFTIAVARGESKVLSGRVSAMQNRKDVNRGAAIITVYRGHTDEVIDTWRVAGDGSSLEFSKQLKAGDYRVAIRCVNVICTSRIKWDGPKYFDSPKKSPRLSYYIAVRRGLPAEESWHLIHRDRDFEVYDVKSKALPVLRPSILEIWR